MSGWGKSENFAGKHFVRLGRISTKERSVG